MRLAVWLTALLLIALLISSSLLVVRCNDQESDDESDSESEADVENVKPVKATTPTSPPPPPPQQPAFPEIETWSTPTVSPPPILVDGFDAETVETSGWVRSRNAKYAGGVWRVQPPHSLIGIKADRGLVVGAAAAHHAIVRAFDAPLDVKGKDLVVQYEVKLQQPLNCGGAYLKLPLANADFSPVDFSNDSPYVIMFGPDRCGATNKVHFIFRHKNPKSGEWKEHHLKRAPVVPNDAFTHLYTLVVHPNDTYKVLVDNVVASEGSLLENFDPPVVPPAEIDDPTDSKPSDWVDQAKIPDPEASKPDDWDETLPSMIEDENAVKPDDWLENEPTRVADPNAQKPEDWDDEDDGEWEAPTIPNPKCSGVSGCGKWKRPFVKNPAYRGKWMAPLIDNPAYKGEWKPRQIPNPDFYEGAHPSSFAPIAGVGIEIWTMQDKILFDNILVGHSEAAAREFADKTFQVKRNLEKKREDVDRKAAAAKAGETPSAMQMLTEALHAESLGETLDKMTELATTHPLPFIGVALFFLVFVPMFLAKCVRRRVRQVDMPALRKFEAEQREAEAARLRAPVASNGRSATAATETAPADAAVKPHEEEEEEEEEEAEEEEAREEAHNRAGASSTTTTTTTTTTAAAAAAAPPPPPTIAAQDELARQRKQAARMASVAAAAAVPAAAAPATTAPPPPPPPPAAAAAAPAVSATTATSKKNEIPAATTEPAAAAEEPAAEHVASEMNESSGSSAGAKKPAVARSRAGGRRARADD